MHSRRFACLLIGMWLAGGLIHAWLAHADLRAVDRLLAEPDPAATLRIKVLGPAESAMLLHYQMAEAGRREMQLWQLAQIGLGAFLLFFMLFATSEGKTSLALCLILLVSVALQRLAIWPEIVALGRLTDFLPPTAGTGYRTRLLVMESGFFAVEIGKAVALSILAAILIGRGRSRNRASSGSPWKKFHVVDKADDRHVDR